MKKKIAIVGAGPGGLASAMLLAHRGFDVTVFEKAARIGGRNAEMRVGDYLFDVGPTFLMMKYLLDDLFREVGRETADFMDCRRLDPMYRLYFGERSMLVTSDVEKMKVEIEKLFPGESGGLERFYRTERERFAHLYPCLQKDYGSLRSFLSLTLLKAFPHLAAGRSLYEVLSDYFQSEDLRIAFTFQSKYLGMSPWECPGLFAMIPYTEHAHGVFHVLGGLSKIAQGFARAAENFGARIRTATPVKRVIVEGGAARGVELENGERFLCDDVVLNADFGHAVEKLFPPGSLRSWTPERLKKTQYSCSTFMLYLGLDKIYPTDFHTIYFAKDYKQNIFDIAAHRMPADDFSIYVRNASTLDPSLAPAGQSALYVLVPMPNNRSGIDWDQTKTAMRERVLSFLEKRAPYQDLRQHIRAEAIITPQDWEEKLDVYRGATFNMGHGLKQLLYLRPHNEFEDLKNCYLVGGGTHPGSGLPTIFESARISSNLLCQKYGTPFAASVPFSEDRLP